MLQPGTILDSKYRIEGVIGRGGFGYVYRARERLTGEIVAVKELVPSFVDDREMVQRFIQEARATLRLTHTHIARTYTIFEDRDTYYLAMEYLAGGSLADRLERGLLPAEEALRIARELCQALAYAHERGVVHCDIKPANVLFDEDGAVRLADFGIAHVSAELMTRQFFTASGTAMGTVRYMAPEQLEGVRDDPRVDIYALGALLYEMLAGRPYLDFDTDGTPGAQARNIGKIQNEPPRPLRTVNPAVPAWLARVVEQALRKARQERFATAEALWDALEEKQGRRGEREPLPPTQLVSDGEREPEEGRLGKSRSSLPLPKVPSSERSRRVFANGLDGLSVWGWALGGLAAVALLVGGGMWLQRVIRGNPATPLAATAIPEPTSTLRPTSTTSEPTPTLEPPATSTSVPPTETPRPTRTPTPKPTAVPSSAILYLEDFEDGTADAWEQSRGEWRVEQQSNNYFWSGTGRDSYPQAWLDDELDPTLRFSTWQDYAFESRVRFPRAGSLFMCARAKGGASFYNAHLHVADNWVQFADYDVTEVDEDDRYQSFGGTSHMLEVDHWYTVRFELEGSHLRVYIDDDLVTSAYRDTWYSGGVGFYMGGGDEIHFDDIRIWSLE